MQNTPYPLGILAYVAYFINFLASFSFLREWVKILVVGTALEALRRLSSNAWSSLYSSFFTVARFEQGDSSYGGCAQPRFIRNETLNKVCSTQDWMMLWLSQQHMWKNARDIQILTSSLVLESGGVKIEVEPDEVGNSTPDGGRQLAYLPSPFTASSMWYKHHWMRVIRTSREGYCGRRDNSLELRILSRDHSILNQLLNEARKLHQAHQQSTIGIYSTNTSNHWRLVAFIPKRPWSTIVLEPGIKNLIVEDANNFLQSKDWYIARGIPFRRGYLLYGAPGSGKTSLIHSLAGELGLDIYIISLSRIGLDDAGLSEIIADLPPKCIALMEDIDVAFNHGINQEAGDGSKGLEMEAQGGFLNRNGHNIPATSKITLSGLLNSLDGVGAQEGRILFATTNKHQSLDPALCRPGRMDVCIEFKLASKYQAEQLYQSFYLPDSETSEEEKEKEHKKNGNDESWEKLNTNLNIESPCFDPLQSIHPNAVLFSGEPHRRCAPKLSHVEVADLAAKFGKIWPDNKFSMAALQGYLMAYKVRPHEAILEAPVWIAKQHRG